MNGTKRMIRGTASVVGVLMLHLGCSGARGPAASSPTTIASRPHSRDTAADDKLGAVARIHGGAGPWAVAGYRMGEYALGVLGLEHGSFDLEVVHFTPREVQYACIADGAAAA